jgi:hypothetical protein
VTAIRSKSVAPPIRGSGRKLRFPDVVEALESPQLRARKHGQHTSVRILVRSLPRGARLRKPSEGDYMERRLPLPRSLDLYFSGSLNMMRLLEVDREYSGTVHPGHPTFHAENLPRVSPLTLARSHSAAQTASHAVM